MLRLGWHAGLSSAHLHLAHALRNSTHAGRRYPGGHLRSGIVGIRPLIAASLRHGWLPVWLRRRVSGGRSPLSIWLRISTCVSRCWRLTWRHSKLTATLHLSPGGSICSRSKVVSFGCVSPLLLLVLLVNPTCRRWRRRCSLGIVPLLRLLLSLSVFLLGVLAVPIARRCGHLEATVCPEKGFRMRGGFGYVSSFDECGGGQYVFCRRRLRR